MASHLLRKLTLPTMLCWMCIDEKQKERIMIDAINRGLEKISRLVKYRKIENSVIYEFKKDPYDDTHFHIYGPIANNTIKPTSVDGKHSGDYAQVIDGKIVNFFKSSELLFLKKHL